MQTLAELQTVRASAAALLRDIDARIAALQQTRFADAITPDVPQGYDTILGYLAKHHADALSLIDYHDPVTTARDGFKLMHLCRKYGYSPVRVPAPACLREHGIAEVNAYPVNLLRSRWW